MTEKQDRRKRYEQKRIIKQVSLNPEKEEDSILLAFIEKQGDFSGLVKKLLKEHIQKEEKNGRQ